MIEVSLVSGHSVAVPVSPTSTIHMLRTRAEEAFNLGPVTLLSPLGQRLLTTETVEAAGLKAGDLVTALVTPTKLAASSNAFALLSRGEVLTWNAAPGGLREIQEVQQIQSSSSAFAAILASGKVVTWGDPEDGGDSREVQDRLVGVQAIQSTGWAFAAILSDGSVATWGDPRLRRR